MMNRVGVQRNIKNIYGAFLINLAFLPGINTSTSISFLLSFHLNVRDVLYEIVISLKASWHYETDVYHEIFIVKVTVVHVALVNISCQIELTTFETPSIHIRRDEVLVGRMKHAKQTPIKPDTNTLV